MWLVFQPIPSLRQLHTKELNCSDDCITVVLVIHSFFFFFDGEACIIKLMFIDMPLNYFSINFGMPLFCSG